MEIPHYQFVFFVENLNDDPLQVKIAELFVNC